MIRWPAVALLTAVTACASAACSQESDDPASSMRTGTTGAGPTSPSSSPTPPRPTSPVPPPTKASSNPAPSNPGSARPLRLSVDDEGRTITLGIGDEAFLTLGGGYDWADPQLDGTTVSITEQVSDEATNNRTWEVVAHTRGSTELTVAGSPTCRSTTPPCLAPDRTFTIRFEVLAPDP